MRKILFTTLIMTFVQAQAEDSFRSYEDIVKDLTSPAATSANVRSDISQLDTIRIHASVGPIASRLNLKLPEGLPSSTSLGGVEAIMGIDLFTPKWIAEGAVRSFNREEFASSEISLKEFDLRIIRSIATSKSFNFRIGGGMSARYLTFSNAFTEAPDTPTEYTTPASLILFGAQTMFSDSIGLTAELAYRSRLVSDTADRNSFDGSVRISGSF